MAMGRFDHQLWYMEVVSILENGRESLNIVSAFEALGKKFNNTITRRF
jgi:hypothetical protein